MFKKWREKRKITKILKKLNTLSPDKFENKGTYKLTCFMYEDKSDTIVLRTASETDPMLILNINGKEYHMLDLIRKQQILLIEIITNAAIFHTKFIEAENEGLKYKLENKEKIWN